MKAPPSRCSAGPSLSRPHVHDPEPEGKYSRLTLRLTSTGPQQSRAVFGWFSPGVPSQVHCNQALPTVHSECVFHVVFIYFSQADVEAEGLGLGKASKSRLVGWSWVQYGARGSSGGS
uniref:Uncharacterized protein n=1 Tax=Eutreptiella gymnastica TaxID=73025 RepID=A0A7S1NFJ0_9EUGL